MLYTKIKMTEEKANAIDKILQEARDTQYRTVKVNLLSFEYSKNKCYEIGEILSSRGYGNYLGNGTFQVTPLGMSYVDDGGFLQEYKAALEKQKRDELQAELTEKQIKAAKREPWLIFWGIVSTIINLILMWLQL